MIYLITFQKFVKKSEKKVKKIFIGRDFMRVVCAKMMYTVNGTR